MFGKKFGSSHNNNIGQRQRLTDNNYHPHAGHVAGGHNDGNSNKQRYSNNNNNDKRSRDESSKW